MTFTEIRTEVAERLNLTSTTALARIGRSINQRHREVASSVGMQTTGRITGVVAHTAIGSRTIAFPLQKVFTVYDTNYTGPLILGELSYHEMRIRPTFSGDPSRAYAVQSVTGSTTTLLLDSTPATVHTLTADGEASLMTLSGTMAPLFPENFHDLLIAGTMAIEYEKMEKQPLADVQENKFQQRISELRFFLAKSAWLDIQQAKSRPIA